MKIKSKRISLLMSILFTIAVLCGCGSDYEYELVENIGIDISEEDVFLLNDSARYEEYLGEVMEGNISEEFKDKISDYEKDYFEDNMLIVIYHVENTGSSEIWLEDITYIEESINVVLGREVPEVVDDSMKGYGIIIELPKNDKYTSVEYTVSE